MKLIEAYSNRTSKREIIGALGLLVMVFLAFFVFEAVLYSFYPDLNPLLAIGLHLCFIIVVYLLVLIWGSKDRVREIVRRWVSFLAERLEIVEFYWFVATSPTAILS